MPRERAKERFIDNAIKKTLAYGAIFKYPLTLYQLYIFLISDRKTDFGFFKKELAKMTKKGTIGFKAGTYYDKRIKPLSWQIRYDQTQFNLTKAHEAAKILKHIPWIRMICVTGSTAAYNAGKEDDIDFFIVTDQHRLWLTRLFTVLILKITGVYVKKPTEAGKICPNLFIDDHSYEWPVSERTLYVAHEIAMMQPIYDREQTYLCFMAKNRWINNYLANYPETHIKPLPKTQKVGRLLNLAEKIASKAQKAYMREKITTEIITAHTIHFKKNDNAPRILQEYKKLNKN